MQGFSDQVMTPVSARVVSHCLRHDTTEGFTRKHNHVLHREVSCFLFNVPTCDELPGALFQQSLHCLPGTLFPQSLHCASDARIEV